MDRKTHILICDDDHIIHESLGLYLTNEGFSYTSAFDGEEGLAKFRLENPDLIILDLMMPKLSGIEVCREIRHTSNVPIIMLTAKSEEIDKIVGLEIGTDDYITKPFSMREVVARIKAVLRRVSYVSNDRPTIIIHELEINPETYQVIINGVNQTLTPKEFELLYLLASNPGQVIDREQIGRRVWGVDDVQDTRTIDTHIKRIRQKITVDNSKWSLVTVYGIGYKFEVID